MRTHRLFSVPVGEYTVKDKNLLESIRAHLEKERQAASEVMKYSIRGKSSYHTKHDLTDLDTDWSRQLKELILKVATEWHGASLEGAKVECWGMCMSEGDFTAVHHHPGCTVCGVLYVGIPFTKLGELVLLDPVYGRRATETSSHHVDIKPKEGVGVVFPPWLEHYVEPFEGEGVRYSIAWNVTN